MRGSCSNIVKNVVKSVVYGSIDSFIIKTTDTDATDVQISIGSLGANDTPVITSQKVNLVETDGVMQAKIELSSTDTMVPVGEYYRQAEFWYGSTGPKKILLSNYPDYKICPSVDMVEVA